ncbi:MAG: extracellular solute-binding protein [Chloroflexi bacterium]|nr:extracellular solute-binding protein [Chloroflexota bacterium]
MPTFKTRDEWKASYDAHIAELVAGSKKEGSKLVVYMGRELPAWYEQVTKYFKEKYGIDVEFMGLGAFEAASKIKAEVAAGKVTGDYQASGSSLARPMALDGFYQYYLPPAGLEPGINWFIDPLLDVKDPAFAGKAFSPIISVSMFGIMINTKLVPPDKEPKTWKDLLDPAWKGKLIMQDPSVSGSGNRIYWGMSKRYGADFLKQLVTQNLFIERNEANAARAVASGGYAMYIGSATTHLRQVEGSPVKVIFPEGVVLSIDDVGVITGAPHLNAARLFANFQISKDGQEISTKYGERTPIRGDVKPALDILDTAGKKILYFQTYDDDVNLMPQLREQAKQIFNIK